jgi:hypothetical protein
MQIDGGRITWGFATCSERKTTSHTVKLQGGSGLPLPAVLALWAVHKPEAFSPSLSLFQLFSSTFLLYSSFFTFTVLSFLFIYLFI